jgi:hypothetical protein
MSATWLRTLAAASLLVGGAACGGDDEVAVPAAEDLATHLITAETYDGEWTVNVPPDAPDVESGVIPEEFRPLLPGMELCDRATDESRAAVEELRWQAFRQLDLAVDDPIEPPADRSGHMVFVQEFLLAGEPDEIETTFDLLRDGMEACLGEMPAGEEGPGTAEAMTLPEVGDDRYGVLYLVAEQGDWAEWRLHNALVREGPVLALFDIVDIRADVEPYYTVDEVGEMVTTAVDLW